LVQSVRLDKSLRDIERLDLIKIDIEGAEYMALDGAKSIIQQHNPIIVSEFCPPMLEATSNMSGQEYLDLLRLDGTYSIGILNEDGGLDMLDNMKIMDIYQQTDKHLDIVAQKV